MATVVVDASGAACPVPILELAKEARRSAPGSLVELVATDPAVEADLSAWCAATGSELLSLERKRGVYRAHVRLGRGVGPRGE